MRPTATSDPLVGDVLDGRYEVLAKLARGGMATVYRAWDRRLERIVAIKVMHEGLGDDTDFAAKLDREARAAARLCDQNVVAIFDQGHDHGRPYIVMEFVEGFTLRNLITKEAPLSPLRALQLIEPVAAALAVAHDSGLVHRDVKPENVLISSRGAIKVADFGLARTITAQTSTATQGLLIGTVSYLPPELLTTGRAHSWSDIYSTGILLFEMLTGSKPYTGDTPITVAYKHVNEDVSPPSVVLRRNNPQQSRREPIPDYIDALVLACTRRNPQARPADGRELLSRIRRARRALERGTGNDEALCAIMFPAQALPWSIPAPDETATAAAAEPTPRTSIESPAVTQVAPPLPAAESVERPVVRGASYTSAALAPVRQTSPSYLDDDDQPPRIRPRANQFRRRRIALAVLVLLLVLTVGVAGWWFTTGRYVATPSVINQKKADAVAIAQANDMTIDFTEQYSETVPAGLVISSVPGPGDRVVRQTKIAAVLSLGPERFAMPKVVGLGLEEAKAALKNSNLVAGTITEAWHESVAAGIVLEAGNKEGEQLKRDTTVNLVVSKGREPLTIPSVVNLGAEEASKKLTDAGFKVVLGPQAFDPRVPAGQVISQDPASGTGYRGDSVTIVVSKGPEMVKVPDVVGNRIEEATKKLEDAGLEPEVVWAHQLPIRQGRVLSTEPDAGKELAKGSTVKVNAV